MKNKILLITLSIILTLSFTGAAIALESPTTRYTYISSTENYLGINGSGLATCSTKIIADSYVDSVNISMYLQKLSGTTWVTVQSWSGSANGNRLNLYKTQYVGSGYQYRLKGVFRAYYNNDSETTTNYNYYFY